MQLKTLGALMVAGCALCGLGGNASAQDYPNRPVKMIIAFSPAGAIDVLGRLIADKLSTMWGQQVIVENRPGAAATSARLPRRRPRPTATRCISARRRSATNVTLAPSTAFHPVTSFEPIMLVAPRWRCFMVANVTPFNSVKEVVDYAKANPGKLNYASVGIGTSAHLATVLFSEVTGVKMQHVPYSQMSQTYADLFSGRTEIWFTHRGRLAAAFRAGKLRALAVNGPARSKLLPELPTMSEVGVNDEGRVELVRLLRAEGHAEGHHRQDQPRSADRDRHARHAGEGTVARLPFHRRLAGQAWRPFSTPRSRSGRSSTRRARSSSGGQRSRSLRCRVISTSARGGVGSPLGWLCTS